MSQTTPLHRAAFAGISLLSIFGIAVSVYMTQHHEMALYSASGFGEIAGCKEAAGVSCDVVNTSEWSELFSVPLYTWAIPTYLTMMALALWAAVKDRSAAWPLFLIALGASGFSIFLGYISKVVLQTWCMWCIRLYIVHFVMLGLSAFTLRGTKAPTGVPIAIAMLTFLLTAGGAIGAQRSYRATLIGDGPEAVIPDSVADTTGSDASLVKGTPPADGKAPILSWEVQTEDKNTGTLRLSENDAWKGNPDSKIAVVEFADFECGYCKRASGELKKLYEAYGDRVLFVYKHFPMDPACNPGVKNRKHRRACLAAEAAVCVQKQGYFWSFHDLAFKNQHQLKKDDLIAYAEKAGADKNTFIQCMQSREGLAQVRADGEMGKSIDLHGTPRIWVDGKLYRAGQSAVQMANAIEVALGADATQARQKALAMRTERVAVEPIADDVPTMRTIQLADGTTFEIDTFEAGLDAGTATVGKHQIPGTRMSWFAANDACTAAGKRMCTEQEWIAACQGAAPVDDDRDGAFADDMVEGTTYPYADYHEPRRCWDGQDRSTKRPVYTGEMPGCKTKDGVYDMAGNVEEWVGGTADTAVLLGGAFDTSKDHARCYRRNDTFGPGYANLRTGFRCCR